MATCILVLGPPRSGTSAVAGVLHHLGVFVGDDLVPASIMNQAGFFVDMEFDRIFTEVYDMDHLPGAGDVLPAPHSETLRALIRKRNAAHKLWAVKCLYLATGLQVFLEECGEVRVIRTHREHHRSAASFASHTEHPPHAIAELITKSRESALAVPESVPVLDVAFDDLLNHREATCRAIADFAGVPVRQAALDFIDPSLRRF